MLGKLIKYEFKNTYKVMLAVYAAYILLTVFGSISSYTLAKGYSEPNVLTISVIVFYVLSCVAIYVTTFVYICIRYYRTMYSVQGYLTHTLPVNGISVFNAKLLVSTIWMIISVLLLMISIFFFANAVSSGEVWNNITAYSWAELDERLVEEIGVSFSQFVGMIVFGIVFGMILINLWIFASFAFGQLSDKHKVACSVVAGMVMYFLFQILGLGQVFATIETIDYNSTRNTNLEVSGFILNSFASAVVFSIVICVILYGICVVINKRKLNLE